MTRDERFMRLALAEARRAMETGEIPVGALIVRQDSVISKAGNCREGRRDALAHAEILAIQEACIELGGWRLTGCELFVTLEPCPMCAGAVINSRLDRVVFGASDPKAGCAGSVTDLFSLPFNHRPAVVRGVLEEECSLLLKNFFASLREK